MRLAKGGVTACACGKVGGAGEMKSRRSALLQNTPQVCVCACLGRGRRGSKRGPRPAWGSLRRPDWPAPSSRQWKRFRTREYGGQAYPPPPLFPSGR